MIKFHRIFILPILIVNIYKLLLQFLFQFEITTRLELERGKDFLTEDFSNCEKFHKIFTLPILIVNIYKLLLQFLFQFGITTRLELERGKDFSTEDFSNSKKEDMLLNVLPIQYE